jgi:hypothetical protein|tara:strand:- start:748 stop:945 length:198 start_codon:yes stop_codon:yes gene_type:complete
VAKRKPPVQEVQQKVLKTLKTKIMNDKKAKEERENRKRNNAGKMLAITSGEETAPAKSTRSASKD